MSDAFIEAVAEWHKRKEKYIQESSSTNLKKISPRKNIYVAIPEIFESEIKDFIKMKRKEADDVFVSDINLQKAKLAINFETDNPPPRRIDHI